MISKIKAWLRPAKQEWQGKPEATETSTGTPHSDYKFEINVACKGKHIFATDTHIRSYTLEHLRDMIRLFQIKFPKSEGYRISVTGFCRNAARPVPPDIEEALK